MGLTPEQIRMCTRPGAYTDDALEEAGHRTLKHSGVKGMKWNKHNALEDQGQTGDAKVNGIEVDKEVISRLNEWMVKEKDPKKLAQMRKQLALYKLDLEASKKLEAYNQAAGDPKKQARLAKQLNKLSPNILKNNHYDESRDNQSKEGRERTAAKKRVEVKERIAARKEAAAKKRDEREAKQAARKEQAAKDKTAREKASKALAAERKQKSADKKLDQQIKSGSSKSKSNVAAKAKFEAARKLHK